GLHCYSVLGLSRTATAEEVKARYRELALLHHPDVASEASQSGELHLFAEMTEAYRECWRLASAKAKAPPAPDPAQKVSRSANSSPSFLRTRRRWEEPPSTPWKAPSPLPRWTAPSDLPAGDLSKSGRPWKCWVIGPGSISRRDRPLTNEPKKTQFQNTISRLKQSAK
ncbi:unnamed protein product, partial [Polarella glacialis]